jgi:undecaprenyl-diphosphatase
MTLLQSILLGIVQGLTEFIPVSSSAHLVIVPYLFGWQIPAAEAFIFDVLVQVATLAAVIVYFWQDLWSILRAWVSGLLHRAPFQDAQARLGWYLILASVPAGVFGLLVKDAVESAFASPVATALALFVTAGLLLAAERLGKRTRPMQSLNWKDALWIGSAQALAIFPGVSRSGATIAGGMGRDLQRPPAARFAFLMSVPIMLAAGGLATLDLLEMPGFASLLPVFIPGFLAAALTGYLSIRWLLGYLARRPLTVFAVYCAGLGLLTLLITLVR